MKYFLIVFAILFNYSSSFVLPIPSKLIVEKTQSLSNLPKGTRVYFMSNGAENDLKAIKITSGGGINTNAFDYSLPQPEGNVVPVEITADTDTVTITKPDDNPATLNVYVNNLPSQNINVFPVFQNSQIKFKPGVNAFFGIDPPQNKILTVKDLSLPFKNTPEVAMYSGVPGDKSNFMFFNSSVFKENKHYRQLSVPMFDFYIDNIDSSVLYTVSYDSASSSFQESGVIMSNSFPFSNPGDTLHTVKSSGGQITLHLKPYFNRLIPYNTQITVNFQYGMQQGNDFGSAVNGKMDANGKIQSVEINTGGAFAMQYYIVEAEFPTGEPVTGTTMVETTTKASEVASFVISLVTVFVALFVR